MAARKPLLTRTIELDSIRIDASFYRDLMLQLHAHKSSGILVFGLMPYLSLFTVETFKYVEEVLPKHAYSLSSTHSKIVQASRMRTKFFDDKSRHIGDMFELLDWVSEFHNEWHINKHRGFLAPLKRAIQKDLGIFAYDGHIVGSTHTGLLNLGYEKGDLPAKSADISAFIGPLSHSVSEELGGYLAQLGSSPEFDLDNSYPKYFSYEIQDEKLGYKDVKSQKFFASIFNGPGSKKLNFSLLFLLVTVNYMQHILGRLFRESPSTLFRLKFIMLYHIDSNLRKLQNYFYPKNVLTERSKGYFQAILKDKDLKQIGSQSKFRNVLVHYRINGVPDEKLIPTVRFYGLVEHFFHGTSSDEVEEMLDMQIGRISLLLEEWLNWQRSPGEFTSW